MSAPQLSPRMELAIAAGREAGEITLKYYRGELAVETKADASPVTVADREAEQHLRQRIEKAFPDDAILGEEFGEKTGESGYRWILDPIDGTKSFIYGVPLYGTLIGIEYEQDAVLGVILHPPLDEYVYAEIGQGAWHVRGEHAPQPARVSGVEALSDGLFCTTSVRGFDQRGSGKVYEKLQNACRLSRGWGDCFGYTLVATGRAEVMVDPEMHLWDCAALKPILEEAGGTFTDWQGQPTIYAQEAVATNGKVLEEVLAITRGG